MSEEVKSTSEQEAAMQILVEEGEKLGLYEEAKPTAAEVEAVMVEKEKQVESSPLDAYAGFFQIYSPVFNIGLERLGKKSLIRVMKLLIQYPLEEQHLKSINKAEKDLLKIGDQLLVSKYMMLLHTVQENVLKEEMKERENGNEEKNA